ncbi:non-ribosomal peptide synthetase [Sandaracinus amylolyticus]|uniref:Siderophore biosynthesis non-ribosomal peptide synthetase module n=1 Tax=Sandaracinus amylolyticus TaxID=927083 RepID=A0A0F6W6T2_9BACT|nr:non-ribosomal peptide synthetase [Sandaracinus amylolyticus]AKF08727.1 Siderophore biosynthesis non-ribosomal peptide synthetase module [Sandaracinus amylolyticus]
MSRSDGERLSEAQLGIWLGHQRAHDGTVLHAAECVVFEGLLDVAAFARALDATLVEATALQVAFEEARGEPRRVRREYDGVRLERTSLNGEAELLRHAQREVRRPLDLQRGALSRHQLLTLGPGRYAWLHVAHHIALDGYGFHLVAARVAEHYASLQRDDRLATRGALTAFEPVLDEDDAYQRSPQREADRAFWRDELGARRGLSFGAPAMPGHGLRTWHRWDGERAQRVRDAASRVGVSWMEALLAVIAAHVGERASTRSFLLGLPVMLRLGTRALRTPCMAMNLAALPIDLDAASSIGALARTIRAALARQKRHQRYRYEALRVDRAALGGRLFGPVVNVMPFALPARFGDCSARVLRVSAGPVEELAYTIAPCDEGLELTLDGHAERFDERELTAMARTLERDLDAWLDAPDRPLRPRSTATTRPHVAPTWPLDALGEHARTTPDATALVEGERSWTYAELDRGARRCAEWLRAAGCEPGSLVAIELPRSAIGIVVILGTLCAGAGYVALDPAQPSARRARVIHAAKPRFVVTPDALPHDALEAWTAPGSTTPPSARDDASIAYVVFTSGSTGEPKGVAISTGALAWFVGAASSRYGVCARDRVLQFAPWTFDASVEEIFVTLASGAALVLRDDAAIESPEAFFAACARGGITVLDLPTAFWHELALAVARRALTLPSCVRLVIIGGEAASPERARQWREGAREARLVNTYGPSEATVVATCAALDDTTRDEAPIGTPLPGIDVAIVDEHGAVVTAPGAVGELWLLGPTLATGYLGRDDLTRERFVTLPGCGRAYRTGDLATWRDDGQLAHRGRVDDELKISGHRICPAEVEAALCRHPQVRAAVVWGDAAKRLLAKVEADAIDTTALRRFVREQLPAPMVPSVLEVVARLPRTTHGKIDRVAVRSAPCDDAPEHDPDVSALEARVIEAWRAVLGVTRVELDDDFFALGGHSLHVIQLANRLSGAGAEIRVAEIFRRPTPRAQAALLASAAGAPPHETIFEPGSVSLPPSWAPAPATLGRGRVLLTGATGFVGVHLLASWLERSDDTIVCTVRASDDATARARLFTRAEELGIELGPAAHRIEVIALDLTARDLEIAPCATVFHCAAQVSLARDYDSLAAVNVVATRELLGLALRWGAQLHYVSSIATVPRSEPEERLHPAHAGLVDGYQRSKWQGEALCAEAGNRGLRVAVHRLGRVAGPRRRPSVNRGDLVWRIGRAATRVAAWPDLPVEEPWIPADDAASSMVRLALADAATTPASAYHLVHTGSVALDRVREALTCIGYPLARVSVSDWMTRVRARGDDEDRSTLAFFELRAIDAHTAASATPEYPCARVLARLPDLDTRAVDSALLIGYCRHAQAIGVLPRTPDSDSVRSGDEG